MTASTQGLTLLVAASVLLGGCTVLGQARSAVPPPASVASGSLSPLPSLDLLGASPGASVPASPSVDPSGSPSPVPSIASSPGPASPSPSPSSATISSRPLPRCRYADEPAVGDPAEDWETIVLDAIFRLPADFAPARLVSTKKAGMQAGYEIIPAVVDDLRAMHEASIADGAEIAVRWAYRSYAESEGVFRMWTREAGRERALEISARPGHSEHQLGTAIDFRSADSMLAPWDYDDWGATKPGRWMARNAWRFGFVLSYPKDATDETCYAYEPWHYRYVGPEVAAAIHESGLTPRRYLWETYQGRR